MKTSLSFPVRQYRNALGRFASGITVVTTEHEGRTHGMTANAFVSVSLEPPLVLVSLDKRCKMHQVLLITRRYGVSVLAETQQAFSNHFAGRSVNGLQVPFTRRNEMPLLEGAVAYFVAEVIDVHPAGDHTLYIGHVQHFESYAGRPLLFYAGNYQQIQGGEADLSQNASSSTPSQCQFRDSTS
jgi:flavin reductase (DIM6/NTAB) family NADH-FMN oxidoreductase RutF